MNFLFGQAPKQSQAAEAEVVAEDLHYGQAPNHQSQAAEAEVVAEVVTQQEDQDLGLFCHCPTTNLRAGFWLVSYTPAIFLIEPKWLLSLISLIT